MGYRQFVYQQALTLGLMGFVRNLRHSRCVEVQAEGTQADLKALLLLLQRGPLDARVDAVEVHWSQYRGEYPDFGIRSD